MFRGMQTVLYEQKGKEFVMRKRNIRKAAAALTALALCAGVLSGCGGAASSTASSAASSSAAASSEASGEDADEAAAKNVADLIDAIYVQERNDNTDEQCAAAKAAWDSLTDAQKELVEGENADPDYFGRDTGDASKDAARNEDNIGENELLVVSFGTSFNDSRVKDIKGIEDALQAAYPDWSVRRAFTAQIIINHVQARDGEKIDNMQQALDRAVANGVKNLVVQPTHLMHGAEYDEMCEALEQYKDKSTDSVVNPNFISPRNFMMRLIKCTDEYAAGVGTYYTTSKKLLDTGFWLLGMLEEDSKKLAARDLHELLRCWENYHRLWTVRLHMQHIAFREETRYPGFYYRADFPGIDDKKWKCFVNSKYDPKTGETKVFKRTYYKLIPDAE